MMKKILLVGELNQTVGNLNKYLSGKFDMQLCTDSLELVKGMIKVAMPEMAVICLVGVGTLDHRILDLFQKTEPQIPVLLLGTEEECKYYVNYYNEQFDFIIRPITQSQIIKKCEEMLCGWAGEEPEATQEAEEETVPVERKKVLVVDDSAVLLRNVKAILEKEYDVLVATSGEKGIQMAKKKQPDLIVLDYEMPEMNGKQTMEEIRKDEEIREIPIMFLTGVADKENIAGVLALNPAGYLLKPITSERLMEEIDKILRGRK